MEEGSERIETNVKLTSLKRAEPIRDLREEFKRSIGIADKF